MKPIANLTALTRLDISNTRVSEIPWLSSLVNLKRLNMQGTAVSDLTPLVGLPALAIVGANNGIKPLQPGPVAKLREQGGRVIDD